jgi:hypothetical protein
VILKGSEMTLYEAFIRDHVADFPAEVREINARLQQMGDELGAREGFFKKHEGRPGDMVCALYDRPGQRLRLYCIRFGMNLIILGGGGPKTGRAWQDDPRLAESAGQVIAIAAHIGERLERKEDLWWSADHMHLEGKLNLNNDEEDE